MSNNRNANKNAHDNKQRPARVPLSAGNKLHIPAHLKKEGYFYYWAIDRKGMIEQMEAAYYEKVIGDDDKPLTVPAGGGETHYAMCIETKYHDEDIAAQQKQNIDATAKQAQSLGEEEYVPLGKTHVAERDII
jgi:hypothetical protein